MTRTAVVWIESGLRFACVLVFPALAVWAWRAGGERPLRRLTAVAIGLVLAFAAFTWWYSTSSSVVSSSSAVPVFPATPIGASDAAVPVP